MSIHIAIINLVCRPSRRRRILSLANRLRASVPSIKSVNIIEAVDGVQHSFSELSETYNLYPFSNWAILDLENKMPSSWRVEQTSGGIASGLSHLDVSRWALKEIFSNPLNSKDIVLVMEDDCVISGQIESVWTYFDSCLSDAIKLVPNWHMLLLGASPPRVDIASPKPVPGSSDIEFSGFSYLTTMYFLSCAGANFLDSKRDLCLSNGLAFDELHNALAGSTSVRKDVEVKFNPTRDPLILLSSLQSFVKQDPYDCVHDTAVTRRDSKRHDVEPPIQNHPLVPHHIENAVWWRRGNFEQKQNLKMRFGKKSFLEQILKSRSFDKDICFPKSFDVYYKAKQKRRYGELESSVLFRE